MGESSLAVGEDGFEREQCVGGSGWFSGGFGVADLLTARLGLSLFP